MPVSDVTTFSGAPGRCSESAASTARPACDRRPSAGVDVALVSYHFGNKDQLFAAAMNLPLNPVDVIGAVLDQGLDGAGERLVRAFLAAWEDLEMGSAMLAMFRSAASNEQAGAAFGQFVSHGILGRYREAIDGPDARAAGDPRGHPDGRHRPAALRAAGRAAREPARRRRDGGRRAR